MELKKERKKKKKKQKKKKNRKKETDVDFHFSGIDSDDTHYFSHNSCSISVKANSVIFKKTKYKNSQLASDWLMQELLPTRQHLNARVFRKCFACEMQHLDNGK